MGTVKKGGIAEAIESIKTEDPNVTNKLREDWNNYLSWLDLKGMRGKAELDTNDLGGKMIDEYRKQFPDTSVSRENIIPIQNEFKKYRDWVLSEVAAKRASLAEGTTPETFMKDLSKVDGYAGSLTTSFKFPSSYLNTFLNDKLIKTESQGFAKAGK